MGLAFQTEFSLDIEPRVPMQLRHKVDQHMDHARVVTIVRRHEADKRQTTLNKITLTQTDTVRPKESVDDVALGIAAVMQHFALGTEADGRPEEVAEGLDFVIRWHYWGDKRTRNFTWTWQLDLRDEDDAAQEDAMSLLNPDLEEGSHMYLHAVIARLLDVNQQEALAKERAEMRLVELADRMVKPLEMLDRQAQYSHGILMQGMQAMVNALSLRYDHDAAQAAEAAKSERWERMFKTASETVGPALKVALHQGMTHFTSRARGEKVRVPRAAEYGPDGTPPAAPPAPPPQQPEPETPSDDDILMGTLEGVSLSIRPEQRKMLRKSMDPDALDLFDDLLGAVTPADARDRFTALVEALDGGITKMASILGEFDEDQQQAVMVAINLLHGDAD